MQTESKLAFMAPPTSSTEHSGELDLDRQPPLAGAAAPALKRKRTKRPRHHLPASSASSSESTTTEEEDMAHCLILLAQGGGAGAAVDSKPSPSPVAVVPQPSPPTSTLPPPAAVVVKSSSERYTSRKYTEAATTADGVKAGFYVYECRTCNKCFPTFQALGGHRASHKKPRVLAGGYDEVNNQPPPMTMTPSPQPQPPPPRVVVTTALSLNSHVAAAGSSKGVRVHECSICGAEFASGQALGGHMRRHRPLNAPPVTAITGSVDTTTTKKLEGSINLELDLNLPAPSSDEDLPPVVFGLGQFNDGNKAGLMLTASALVDCHY
jgi:hypothetical protein